MESGQVAWLALFILSLFLIAIGYQGNLGTLIGIIFCPQEVVIGDGTFQ